MQFRTSIQTNTGEMSTRNKSDIISIVKDSINEFFLDKEFIGRLTEKISESIEQKLKSLEEKVKTQMDKIRNLEQKVIYLQQGMDDIQQRGKLKNLCIYGVPEENGERLDNKMLELLKSKTNVPLILSDIVDAYRIGRPGGNTNKTRPTIVKLPNIKLKRELLKCGKNFKGTNIFLTEDLTKDRRTLLLQAKTVFGVKNSWSFNGQIYITKDGRKIKLASLADLRNYSE